MLWVPGHMNTSLRDCPDEPTSLNRANQKSREHLQTATPQKKMSLPAILNYLLKHYGAGAIISLSHSSHKVSEREGPHEHTCGWCQPLAFLLSQDQTRARSRWPCDWSPQETFSSASDDLLGSCHAGGMICLTPLQLGSQYIYGVGREKLVCAFHSLNMFSSWY